MGVPFTMNQETVTTTVTKIMEDNNRRAYLLIQNNGADDIRVGYDNTLTNSTGVLVRSGIAYAPYPCPVNEIWVVRDSGAAGDVAITTIEG